MWKDSGRSASPARNERRPAAAFPLRASAPKQAGHYIDSPTDARMPRGGRVRPCRARRVAGNRLQRFIRVSSAHRVRVASNHSERFEPRSGSASSHLLDTRKPTGYERKSISRHAEARPPRGMRAAVHLKADYFVHSKGRLAAALKICSAGPKGPALRLWPVRKDRPHEVVTASVLRS